ncbi:MAG TPA: hypothetical protein VIG06_09400 [Kofleriaceae bacterium]|jgi:hypothetical protein
MRHCLAVALVALGGCYVDGAIGATTPVAGPATDGARNLLSGDAGVGLGFVSEGGGFDLGVAGGRIPAGSQRNGFGPYGRILFPLGGPHWLRGTARFSMAFTPEEDEEGTTPAGKSVKLSLGVLAQSLKPKGERVMAAGPALSLQWVDIDGLGSSFFIGLELSALIGGEIITWSDSDPDDV